MSTRTLWLLALLGGAGVTIGAGVFVGLTLAADSLAPVAMIAW